MIQNAPPDPPPDTEALFHRALELPVEERAAFLARACGDDAALRQRLEVLLRANDASSRFLSESPAAPSFDALPGDRVIGDYELLEEIARGGMGVVYRARQRRLDRIVALKMIVAGQFASREQALRFQAEAEAAARLQHPNIVRIHETGQHEGRPFFSMDYVEGTNLSALVHERPLTARRAALYVKIIAEAIHYAHEQGVLHRDLKPSNILIDQTDQPRITDFGLAKRVTKESFLTITGEMMGSPSFMPPEQAGAKGVKAGGYSDVYSLGGILFYLVTGRPPFVAENVAEMLHHVLHTEPISPRLLNPSVPQDIATICLKCLEKEPAKRYATAQKLAEETERFLRDEPIHARPVSLSEKCWRFCKRKRALTGALALSIAAIALCAFLGVRAHRAEWRRQAERRQNTIDKALLTAWTGDLHATEQSIREAELAGVSVADVRMLRGSLATHRGDYREAAQHLEQAWKLSPRSVAVASMLIKAYGLLGQWDKAQPLYEDLERLVPTTPEDFLSKGTLEAMVDPTKGLETLNEAVRRRPTGIAGLVRGSVRASVALDAARIDDAEAAIADISAAQAVLPANAGTIALSLQAHLIAAGIYQDHELNEKRAAAWRQVEAAAAALEKHPGNQAAVLARAMYLKHSANDEASFRALRASATNGLTDYLLAVALYRKGEFRAALGLLEPEASLNQSGANCMRGYFLAELPNGPELALKEFYRLWQTNPSTWDALAIQTTLRLLGRKAEAIDTCRKARQRVSLTPWRKEWYRRLLDYNCGDLTEEDLVKAAGASRYAQSEAHFYIGLNRLAEGNRSGAREHFRDAVAARAIYYFDYDWSRNFLARMEQDPNWPPWIPAKPNP